MNEIVPLGLLFCVFWLFSHAERLRAHPSHRELMFVLYRLAFAISGAAGVSSAIGLLP